MKNSNKLSKDILEYELIGLDLQSLAILVEALKTNEIAQLNNDNIRDNCFTLISDMILDRAKLVDEMFKALYERD